MPMVLFTANKGCAAQSPFEPGLVSSVNQLPAAALGFVVKWAAKHVMKTQINMPVFNYFLILLMLMVLAVLTVGVLKVFGLPAYVGWVVFAVVLVIAVLIIQRRRRQRS